MTKRQRETQNALAEVGVGPCGHAATESVTSVSQKEKREDQGSSPYLVRVSVQQSVSSGHLCTQTPQEGLVGAISFKPTNHEGGREGVEGGPHTVGPQEAELTLLAHCGLAACSR